MLIDAAGRESSSASACRTSLLRRRIARRIKKFVTLMPEALDLIVRGIRSGLPATEALKTIAEEIEDPVGSEFRQVTDQMRIGVAHGRGDVGGGPAARRSPSSTSS